MFEKVLANPSEFPQGIEFESILYLPSSAFEDKTGKEYDHAPAVDCESFLNEAGWAPTAKTTPGSCTDEQMPPGNRRPS